MFDRSTAIKDYNYYIINVPSPVDKNIRPDFNVLYIASETDVNYKKGDTIIYESTVYRGATEKVCIHVLTSISGLKFKEVFFAGYSPDRIYGVDKEHTVKKILKVISCSTPKKMGQYVDSI